MCGIVGYVGPRDAVPIIVEGLRRLEYRGYDSAGIAVVRSGKLTRRRAAGKLAEPRGEPQAGAAHRAITASATPVGRPTAVPPRRTRTRTRTARERSSSSTTASSRTTSPEDAPPGGRPHVRDPDRHRGRRPSRRPSLLRLPRGRRPKGRGRDRGHLRPRPAPQGRAPDASWVRASGPPSSWASGDGERFLASDLPALLAHTRDFIFLEDGEIVTITPDSTTIRDAAGKVVDRPTAADLLGPGPGGEGRLPPLHAQGDPRAAARGARHAPRAGSASTRGRSSSRSWGPRSGA